MSRILLTAIGSMAAAPVARRYQALGHTVFGCDIYPREWTPLAGEIDFFQARLATEGEPYVEQLKEAVRRDGLDFLIPLTDPEVDALAPRKAEFRALGCRVIVTTANGSYGVKGFATTPLNDLNYSYFYTCGPEPMLKAVYKVTRTSGQMSFEERMGCGFGACMGCSCKTLTGYKRICKDGPVMRKEEILWEA